MGANDLALLEQLGYEGVLAEMATVFIRRTIPIRDEKDTFFIPFDPV